MERRKINTTSPSLRRELELFVCAWNTSLKEVVHLMDPIILLWNSHPLYRADFAARLKDTGVISKDDAKEFIKLPY